MDVWRDGGVVDWFVMAVWEGYGEESGWDKQCDGIWTGLLGVLVQS